MKNPYHDIFEPEEIRVPRRFGIAALVVFLLICTGPPLVRNVLDAASPARVSPAMQAVQLVAGKGEFAGRKETVTQKLRKLENNIEDAPFTDPPRRFLQQFLCATLRQGNTKTFIGNEGWLFLRPAVRAMTSTGPVAPPALGVASDPNLKNWQRPLPAIVKFAEDLGKRDIELLFVPIPVKPMIYPEGIGGGSLSKAPMRHHDLVQFYDLLRREGISVIDLTEPLWEMKKDGETFLRQDTHWRPEAMERVAEIIADEVRSRSWFESLPKDSRRFDYEALEREHIGDLVEKLDLPDSSKLYRPEKAALRRVIDKESGGIVENDKDSPVVLLGDSFANIFDDTTIGFSPGGEEVIGAGLRQHLAAKLGLGIDSFTRNGSASTGVRQDFARERYDDQVRQKRIVIWTIAARDILFTPALAMENNVVWEDVVWNMGEAPAEIEKILVEATLEGKGPIRDPASVPYKDAFFESLWKDVNVLDGGELPLEDGRFLVRTWAFREKTMTPESRVEEGKRYRFLLLPKDYSKALKTAQGELYDSFIPYPSYYVEKFAEAEGGG